MHNGHQHEGTSEGGWWSAFLSGALIGAGVALLFAPQTGTELRGVLRDYAGRAKDELLEKAEEAYDQGEELVQGAVKDVGQAAKEFVTQATQEAQKAGR